MLFTQLTGRNEIFEAVEKQKKHIKCFHDFPIQISMITIGGVEKHLVKSKINNICNKL